MKNSITKILCLFCFMSFTLVTKSQTKTFDYLPSGLSTSACNVFNPAVNIDGVSHSSYAGGVSFNATYGLGLITTPQNGPPGPGGTAYVVNYSFTPGIKYDISITAIGRPEMLLKTSVVPNFTQFVTNSTTVCVSDNNAYSYQTAGYGQSSNPTSTTSATYAIPQFTITGNTGYPYLIIWASGGRSNVAIDVLYISKIVITPTLPASFNITPITTALTCGSTTPVTFTVNNGANTPGITGYTWNLGSASNGWLFNSSAAPQTISTGTANTLTLTPVCGAVQSNVSATVAANSNNYPTTNAASVSITQPSMSVSGSASFCASTSNYSVVGLPCNATVAWDISPASGIGSIFPTTGPSTTITKVADGNVTLTANVTSCGATTPVTLPVHVGAYTSSDYTLSGNNGSTYYCTNQTISFGVSGGSATNHVWTVPSGWSTVYNGGSYVALRSPSNPYPPTGTVSVSFTEPCGATVTKSMFLAYSSSACNTNDPRFKIYPNPASSYLNVEVDLAVPNNSNTHIVGVQLLNQSATLVYNQSYPNTPGNFYQGVQIPVYNQVNGNYTLRVYDGTTWVTYAVVVQH